MNESISRRFAILPFMWQEERNCPCWSEHLISSVAQLFSVALLKMFLCPVLVELSWCFIYTFTVNDTALGRAQWSSFDEGAELHSLLPFWNAAWSHSKTEWTLKEWRQICDPHVHLFCVFATVWIKVMLEFCLIIKNLKNFLLFHLCILKLKI